MTTQSPPDYDPDHLPNQMQLADLLGFYSTDGKYQFKVASAQYGSSRTLGLIGVPYAEVAQTAQPAGMLQSKWMVGSSWTLRLLNDDSFKADAKLVVAKGGGAAGDLAVLQVTGGG